MNITGKKWGAELLKGQSLSLALHIHVGGCVASELESRKKPPACQALGKSCSGIRYSQLLLEKHFR